MTTNARADHASWGEVLAWAMFDFANSSYTTVIVTVAYSVYFTKLVVVGTNGDFLWSIGTFVSALVVVVGSPIAGAIADESGRKKLFLFATYAICIAGTAALVLVRPGNVVLGLALFVVSNVGYLFGENFAAAFLPEISTPATIGRISGFAWGLGYFGGLGCLVAILPLIRGGFVAANIDKLRLAWLVTAAFFLVAGLPTFLFLKERAPRGPSRSAAAWARAGFRRLATTARSVRRLRHLARFLVVFAVFMSGLWAVVYFAAVYAERTLHFSAGELMLLFTVVQLSSAAGAFVFGFVQDRLGAKRTIQLTLVLWIVVCGFACAAASKTIFFAVALGAGLGIGSLQSASRGLVGLFAPVEKAAEIFAFWGLAGKAPLAIGPPVFGLVSSVTGSQRIAIGSVAIFFVLGLIGMGLVDEAEGRRAAEAWDRGEIGPAAEPAVESEGA